MNFRFAPTLYKDIHIGNLRVLLANYFTYLKNKDTEFYLRVDFSDKYSLEVENENLLNFLNLIKRFDIKFTEIIVQRNRTDIYNKYLKILFFFICGKGKQSYLDVDKIIKYCNNNNPTLEYHDSIFGLRKFLFIKKFLPVLNTLSNRFIYNYTSAIDDYDFNIINIIRGADHLDNTFFHILIFKALDFVLKKNKKFSFSHIPLCIDSEGRKISKSNVNTEVFFFLGNLKKYNFYILIYILFFSHLKPRKENIKFYISNFELKNISTKNKALDFLLFNKLLDKIY